MCIPIALICHLQLRRAAHRCHRTSGRRRAPPSPQRSRPWRSSRSSTPWQPLSRSVRPKHHISYIAYIPIRLYALPLTTATHRGEVIPKARFPSTQDRPDPNVAVSHIALYIMNCTPWPNVTWTPFSVMMMSARRPLNRDLPQSSAALQNECQAWNVRACPELEAAAAFVHSRTRH